LYHFYLPFSASLDPVDAGVAVEIRGIQVSKFLRTHILTSALNNNTY